MKKPTSVLAALLLLSSPAWAATIPLINAYVGITKTLYNVVNRFLGSTTVQPAHALNISEESTYGIYGTHPDGAYYYFGWKTWVRRNTLTGDFSYRTYERDSRTGNWVWVHNDPFWVGDDQGRLALRTYTCVPTPGAPYVYNELESFSLCAWAASVVKSGTFPPAGPFESYLKSSVESRQYNCADAYTAFYGTIRSDRIDLQESGITYVTMPTTQRAYAFPMTQWIGKWYDY